MIKKIAKIADLFLKRSAFSYLI